MEKKCHLSVYIYLHVFKKRMLFFLNNNKDIFLKIMSNCEEWFKVSFIIFIFQYVYKKKILILQDNNRSPFIKMIED